MAELLTLNVTQAEQRLAGAVCCIGVFDGVHLGHQALIDRTIALAQSANKASVVITFSIDPDELFRRQSLKKIMNNEQRISALCELGADYVATLPFDTAFAALSPNDFLESVFGSTTPSKVVVGEDFHFGARAHGDIGQLEQWGRAHGMSAEAFHLMQYDEMPITASRIRTLLEQGSLDQANALLGHAYTLAGQVESGRGEGAGMGFRTANLSFDASCSVLCEGVYAGYAHVGGNTYKTAVSMGVSPTFAERTTCACEAHLLDFNEDIYGSEIAIDFVHRLRPMIKFDSLDELIHTVTNDIGWVRENL